jgi:hypothetical protein
MFQIGGLYQFSSGEYMICTEIIDNIRCKFLLYNGLGIYYTNLSQLFEKII